MSFKFKKIISKDYEELKNFFERNKKANFFDPFPLNSESAHNITNVDKKNLFYGIFKNKKIIGFGMLRWYEDFTSPTLGLLVDSSCQGIGLGTKIYNFLFKKSKEKKCKEVIAIIHKNNSPSIHIAKKLGMIEVNKNKLSLETRYNFRDYFKKNKEKIIFIKNL